MLVRLLVVGDGGNLVVRELENVVGDKLRVEADLNEV